MNIDWVTVGAQIINFLILVWLMKRFLYKPILNAIAAREKRIAEELANAAATKAEAVKEQAEFRHKNEEFAQQRDTLMHQATEEVAAQRKLLLDEARQAANELAAKRQEALNNEANALHQALITNTQHAVFSIARKALSELGSASLEASITEVFIRQLQELQGTDKEQLSQALLSDTEPVILRSVFALPELQQKAIQHTLNTAFSANNPIRFETAPELISGIELSANGYKVAWSIDAYLTTVEKSTAQLLTEQNKAPQPAEKAVNKDA